MTEPFFSICTPTTNRGDTIYNSLKSVAKQQFRDFEVILVDCNSTDDTRKEIERFFNSELYRRNSFDYQINYIGDSVDEIDQWNLPISEASGEYVLKLEGDDKLFPDHLELAHKYLSTNPNVGVYASGTAKGGRNKTGLFTSQEYIDYIYSLEMVPPPSEAIFVREDPLGDPFLYNSSEYQYAPEIDLYIQIAKSGYDAFHSSDQTVLRDRTPNPKPLLKHKDRFTLIEKFKNDVSDQHYLRTREKALRECIQDIQYQSPDQRRELIKFLKGYAPWREILRHTTSSIIQMVGEKTLVKGAYNKYRTDGICSLTQSAINRALIPLGLDRFDDVYYRISRNRLQVLMEDECNLDDVVSTTSDFEGVGPYKSIEMTQHTSEIKSLARRVSESNPSTVMEIGTKLGGTFYIWSRYLDASTLISLDLPGGDFGGGYPQEKIKLLDDFAPNSTSHFVRADSHNSATAEEIETILGENGTVDFLFIDGDHTYEGVKQDFNMYQEFVSEGGIIAFHDICYHPSEGVEVERFWAEIKEYYESEEIIGPERAPFGLGGIGIIYK